MNVDRLFYLPVPLFLHLRWRQGIIWVHDFKTLKAPNAQNSIYNSFDGKTWPEINSFRTKPVLSWSKAAYHLYLGNVDISLQKYKHVWLQDTTVGDAVGCYVCWYYITYMEHTCWIIFLKLPNLRSLFLVYRWLSSFCVLAWSFFCGCMCHNLSFISPYPVILDWGPPSDLIFHVIIPWKARSPNAVTFWDSRR